MKPIDIKVVRHEEERKLRAHRPITDQSQPRPTGSLVEQANEGGDQKPEAVALQEPIREEIREEPLANEPLSRLVRKQPFEQDEQQRRADDDQRGEQRERHSASERVALGTRRSFLRIGISLS